MSPLAFKGVFPILVTPFHDDESLDLESLKRVIGFMRRVGVDGVTVLGVLGEANRLIDAERAQVISAAVEAAEGEIPVIVGASHTGTASTLALSRMARDLGASGVMVAPMREPAPHHRKILEYYQRVAEGADLPIVLQDHPASTGVHLPVDLILRIIDEVPQVTCVKLEAPPTPQKISALLGGMTGREVTTLQGLGALYGLFELERGAAGYMTGFAVPEALVAMVRAAEQKDSGLLREIYQRFLPLIVYEQQPGLAIRKEIYRLRGLIDCPRVRHPGATIDEVTARELRRLLDWLLPGAELGQPLAM